MSNIKIKTRIQNKINTKTTWETLSADYVLLNGELAVVTNENSENWFKVGNGLSTFSQLPYATQLIKNISISDYNQLVVDDNVDENTLYILSGDVFEMYGQRVVNVAPGTELSDAINYEQFLNLSTDFNSRLIDNIDDINNISIMTQNISNNINTLSNEISTKSSIFINDTQSNLNIKYVLPSEYAEIIQNNIEESCLYILSGEYANACGQRVKNVAPAEVSSDAVNYGQMSNILSTEYISKKSLRAAISSLNSSSTINDIVLALSSLI